MTRAGHTAMEAVQRHGRKFIFVLIAAFMLFALLGSIAIALKGDIGIFGAEGIFKAATVESPDDQKNTPRSNEKTDVGSQGRKVDVVEARHFFSRLLAPGRNRAIVMLAVGLIILAVIVATTVGVLYQQGLLTDTDSAQISEEEQKRLEDVKKAEEDARGQNEAKEALKRTAEIVLGKDRRWFHVRLGVFIVVLVVNFILFSINWLAEGKERKVLLRKISYGWYVFEVFTCTVMGAICGIECFLYCLAATISGLFLLELFSYIPILEKHHKPVFRTSEVMARLFFAILALIGPIIHMVVLGSQLWGPFFFINLTQ